MSKDTLDKLIEKNYNLKPITKNNIMENTNDLIEFEIVEKPFKEVKKVIKTQRNIISESIYAACNKLIVSETYPVFIPINVLPSIKNPYSVVNAALKKLIKFNKNAGNIVDYTIKVSKDENKKILGYYVWRIQ